MLMNGILQIFHELNQRCHDNMTTEGFERVYVNVFMVVIRW